MLVSSEAIDITLRIIKIEAFYFKNHQEIYRAILKMHNNKIPVDVITLSSYLQDNQQAEHLNFSSKGKRKYVSGLSLITLF